MLFCVVEASDTDHLLPRRNGIQGERPLPLLSVLFMSCSVELSYYAYNSWNIIMCI